MGRVCRYPVKGMGGQDLDFAHLTASGIPFDRVVAFSTGQIPIQPHGTWTTHRAFHALTTNVDMALGQARVTANRDRQFDELHHSEGRPLLDPTGSGVLEISRAGQQVAAIPIENGVPRLEHASLQGINQFDDGRGPNVEEAGVSLWDVESAHISIINLETVRAMDSAAEVTLDPTRFRGNLYVDGLKAWSEFELVGQRLKVGDAELEVFSPIERCRATAARPGAATWDIDVPGLLMGHFGHAYCGLYARIVLPGTVRVGDMISVVSGRHEHLQDRDADLIAPGTPRMGTVVSRLEPSPGVVSLTIRDPYLLLATATPGQYLRLHGIGQASGWRNYTISGLNDDTVRITVQLKHEGRFSPHVHAAAPGDQVLVSGPHGKAALNESSSPVAMVTAGIGITPALRLIQHLARSAPQRPVQLLHVAGTAANIPHWDELQGAVSQLEHCKVLLYLTRHPSPSIGDNIPANLERDGAVPGPQTTGLGASTTIRHERPTAAELRAEIAALVRTAPDLDLFVCGPVRFADSVVQAAHAASIPTNRIHRDPFYSPPEVTLERLAPPDTGPFIVHWEGATDSRWTPEAGTLLELAEHEGLQPEAGCRSGVCGTCAAAVNGDIFYVSNPMEEPDDERVLLCVAVPLATSKCICGPPPESRRHQP